MRIGKLMAVLIVLVSGCAIAPTAPQHDDLLARTQVLALVQTLNANLLSHHSATLTLERWCESHHLAEPAKIVARRMHGEAKPIPEDLRVRLAIDANEPIGYRHVQLMCGRHVLSEADNWYIPARLTSEMNQRLDGSDEPFGKVVRALRFQRRTLTADLLWSPLPFGWEMKHGSPAQDSLRIPYVLLRHLAILTTSTQLPFSAVVETYTNQVLDFGRWATHLSTDARP
ncbi:MAG: hypothetical protein ABIR10_01495 [Dokdonella sp.]